MIAMSSIKKTHEKETVETSPGQYTDEDLKYFEQRYVLPEDAKLAGIHSLSCSAWEVLKSKHPSFPHPGGKAGGIAGLLVVYPPTLDRKRHFRVRARRTHYYVDTVDGKGERVEFAGKWFTDPSGVVPYVEPETLETGRSTPIIFVESPIKMLAVNRACRELGLPHRAVGLGGVEAGGHVPDAPVPTLHPELKRIDWRGRTAIVFFDVNIHRNPGVARGAARQAFALAAEGASVRIAFLPPVSDHDLSVDEITEDPGGHLKYGPDDYLAKHGPAALRQVVESAVAADPVERIRSIPGPKEVRREVASQYMAELYFAASLKIGGAAVLDAVAAELKKLDISKATLKEAIRVFDAKVASKSRADEPEWKGKLRRSMSGAATASTDNVVTVLSHDPAWAHVLAYDSFSRQIVKCRTPPWPDETKTKADEVPERARLPWVEEDDTKLCDYLGRTCSMTITPERVYQAVLIVAEKGTYHPVRDAFDALTWDGESRVDSWLIDYVDVEDSTYTRMVGRFFLLQLIARVYKSGCKADYVLILEGPTGFRKSTLLEELLPRREWFSDTPFQIGTKDGYTALRGKVLIELAELVTHMRTESNASKAFFTSRSDRYRPPYAKHDIDAERSCVFAGTINPEGTGYLRDRTGNRRYWPVHVPKLIDIERFRLVRDQVLAEALLRFKQGERYYPTPEEEREHFVSEQSEREEESATVGVIEAGVAKYNEMTVAFVMGAILEIPKDRWQREQRTMNEIATTLTRLGFERRNAPSKRAAKPGEKGDATNRVSVRIYRRIPPLEDAWPFDPSWTSKQDTPAEQDAKPDATSPEEEAEIKAVLADFGKDRAEEAQAHKVN